jgi:hypothetical protein
MEYVDKSNTMNFLKAGPVGLSLSLGVMGGQSGAGTAAEISAHAAQRRRWKGLALTLGATLLVSPDALCVTLASTYSSYSQLLHFLAASHTHHKTPS